MWSLLHLKITCVDYILFLLKYVVVLGVHQSLVVSVICRSVINQDVVAYNNYHFLISWNYHKWLDLSQQVPHLLSLGVSCGFAVEWPWGFGSGWTSTTRMHILVATHPQGHSAGPFHGGTLDLLNGSSESPSECLAWSASPQFLCFLLMRAVTEPVTMGSPEHWWGRWNCLGPLGDELSQSRLPFGVLSQVGHGSLHISQASLGIHMEGYFLRRLSQDLMDLWSLLLLSC